MGDTWGQGQRVRDLIKQRAYGLQSYINIMTYNRSKLGQTNLASWLTDRQHSIGYIIS